MGSRPTGQIDSESSNPTPELAVRERKTKKTPGPKIRPGAKEKHREKRPQHRKANTWKERKRKRRRQREGLLKASPTRHSSSKFNLVVPFNPFGQANARAQNDTAGKFLSRRRRRGKQAVKSRQSMTRGHRETESEWEREREEERESKRDRGTAESTLRGSTCVPTTHHASCSVDLQFRRVGGTSTHCCCRRQRVLQAICSSTHRGTGHYKEPGVLDPSGSNID